MRNRIDETDVQILEILQEDGRISLSEISSRVGLSVPSVSERIRKMEEREVIRGYHAEVDNKRIHLDITAFIRVMVDGSKNHPEFVRRAGEMPSVLEVHSITGEGSHILKVCTRNTTTLEQLLSKIQSWPGIHGTSTSVVLSTYKETRTLPVEPTELYLDEEEA